MGIFAKITHNYEVISSFIAPQAHFRKVGIHVVRKLGCVLHGRRTTFIGAVPGNLQPQPGPSAPPKVGIMGYLLVELNRFQLPDVPQSRGPRPFEGRELGPHTHFMGLTHPAESHREAV